MVRYNFHTQASKRAASPILQSSRITPTSSAKKAKISSHVDSDSDGYVPTKKMKSDVDSTPLRRGRKAINRNIVEVSLISVKILIYASTNFHNLSKSSMLMYS